MFMFTFELRIEHTNIEYIVECRNYIHLGPWSFRSLVTSVFFKGPTNIVEKTIWLTPPTFVKLPWTLAPPSEWRY